MILGYEEGATCNREGCDGRIELEKVENCSCHLSAPCWGHVNADMECRECGWRAATDPVCVHEITTYNLDVKGQAVFYDRKPRILDRTKIDYVCEPHSSSSMVKKGVFPPGLTMAEVRKEVDGTFGGRFESFHEGSGTFKFIAYTD